MTLLKLSGILLLAALTALPASALTLAELEKSYDDKQSEIRLEKDKSLSGLNEGYVGALARILTKYQRAGRLDEVLLVKDEIKNISDGKWPLLALPKKISLEVAEPRKLYLKKRIKIEQSAARQTAETADKMLALLEKQAVNLTKKDDLQQALLARQIKADIESDAKLASARKLLANVMSDGRSRPALRIRRYGDNIEVIVRYDMRGKVSMDSPVSNVEEADKSIGDTMATVLGEFVGAKGFDVDPYVSFAQTFDNVASEFLKPTDTDLGFKHTEAGETGVRLSFKVGGKYPYIHLGQLLPIEGSIGTAHITCTYFVPKSNKSLIGIHFKQGVRGGRPLGGLTFREKGKWSSPEFSAASASEQPDLLLYLDFTSNVFAERSTDEYLVLKDLKAEQIKFTAFVVQRLGENGVIVEEYKDSASQPKFASNGELLPQ